MKKAIVASLIALSALSGTAYGIHMSEGRAQACGEEGCQPCGPHEWAIGSGSKAHGYWETYKCVDGRKYRRR